MRFCKIKEMHHKGHARLTGRCTTASHCAISFFCAATSWIMLYGILEEIKARFPLQENQCTVLLLRNMVLLEELQRSMKEHAGVGLQEGRNKIQRERTLGLAAMRRACTSSSSCSCGRRARAQATRFQPPSSRAFSCAFAVPYAEGVIL